MAKTYKSLSAGDTVWDFEERPHIIVRNRNSETHCLLDEENAEIHLIKLTLQDLIEVIKYSSYYHL